jgi:hypothetical protein
MSVRREEGKHAYVSCFEQLLSPRPEKRCDYHKREPHSVIPRPIEASTSSRYKREVNSIV